MTKALTSIRTTPRNRSPVRRSSRPGKGMSGRYVHPEPSEPEWRLLVPNRVSPQASDAIHRVLPVGVQIPFARRTCVGRLLANREGWPVGGGCRLIAG